MEALIQEVLVRLERMESGMNEKFAALRQEMNDRFDHLNRKLDEYQAENIAADEKLLTLIGVTNDRLDYQLSRVVKSEEEIFLLKRAGKLRFDPT